MASERAGDPARALTAPVPVSTGSRQPDFALELRLSGGGASLGLSQTRSSDPFEEVDIGSTAAATSGVAFQWGWFAGSHVQLGFAHSLARYVWVGNERVTNLTPDGVDYWTTQRSYTLLSPLGVYVELFPWSEEGLFIGLSGALGVVPGEDGLGGMLLMAGYGVEVGHELSGATKDGPALLLRYARWAGEENPLHTDFPAGVVSHELTLGARWTLGSGD